MMKLNVNGKDLETDAPSDTPLLWVLREDFKLNGSKYSCGTGFCGACMVLLDGEPLKSCVMPISGVGSKKIVTIEGLDAQSSHPVQVAWRKHNVAQCGFCQSGQILAAAALLERDKNPSTETIKSSMAGNLCRCGTYPRIEKAIKTAAELMRNKESIKGAGDHG